MRDILRIHFASLVKVTMFQLHMIEPSGPSSSHSQCVLVFSSICGSAPVEDAHNVFCLDHLTEGSEVTDEAFQGDGTTALVSVLLCVCACGETR